IAILGIGSPALGVVFEGVNTMDVGRAVLVQTELRTILDARTWETIGVGLVEGDFGFEFSAIEVETLVQYQNPKEINGPHKNDPAPTSFVPKAGYHALIEVFGGKDYLVGTPDELKSALSESFLAQKPAIINVIIDSYTGSKSGRLQYKKLRFL
ncbi:hypothetical protein HN51_017252, partial [Arachis hypogaea]